MIGNPGWTVEEKFDTFMGRKENEDELDELVAEWTIKHLAEEVMVQCKAQG